MNLIEEIRNHPTIGIGTCSVIDECFTDQDLLERFSTVGDALALHEIWADRVADAENSAF